ncbi:MAG TPA: hydantoinase/oxoprolinase family protein [Solirubrobacteraceae bacterium]|nr:hydantoinase/oxoprolinase family protein [Solirubrobacteraceae bacterium]
MLLGVDVGGTFTDAVLVVGAGDTSGDAGPAAVDGIAADGGRQPGVYTGKVRSTPAEQSRGVLAAVRAVLEHAGAAPGEVERFAHGMTVATNALLEGRVARTALVATAGFEDVVELGRQARPRLYELCAAAPAPLAPPELRFGVPERMTPAGPLRELDVEAAGELVAHLAQTRPEAVAVVLLHSYAHPQHEQLLGELIARELPGVHVSLSHELVGTFREFERAASTEIDAALSPLLGSYLGGLSAGARDIGLVKPAVMQSAGGLTDTETAASHAALTVLSGPAGGVRGAQLAAELAGEREVLCLDMGGTSCDVCVIRAGHVAETAQSAVAGRPLALAALDIHTVGAGGGSIAWRDPGGALRVGPRSAGAEPGPACYGRGGELPTVTDANLLLGRLPASGLALDGPTLDAPTAERAIAPLAHELGLSVLRCAEGIVRVAEAEMLGALRVISVQRGLDPRGFALLAFGGAGPLHAAALAQELGVERILCPRAAGVLCALGLATAAPRRDAARTVVLTGESFTAARLERERAALTERACAQLGAPVQQVEVAYELRYRGQSFELTIERLGEPAEPAALREAFAAEHELRYGYRDAEGEVELVTIRARAWGAAPDRVALGERLAAVSPTGQPPREPWRVALDNEWVDGELLRGELPPGTRLRGPAVCALPESTLLVRPGWAGEVDAHGTLRLSWTDDAVQEPDSAAQEPSDATGEPSGATGEPR